MNIINIRKFENTDVFQTDVKQVFDFIRCSDDMNKLIELVQLGKVYNEWVELSYCGSSFYLTKPKKRNMLSVLEELIHLIHVKLFRK